MIPVESVSFPRSGHKFTVDLLSAYFGENFRYAGEPHDKSLPPDVDFLKRHDFDLDLEIRPDRRYLVQIRDPFAAIYSWFRMTVESDKIKDSRVSFCDVFDRKLDYWTGFVRKWVLKEYPNVWVFRYCDLISRPEENLRQMILIFGETPDPARVSDAARQVPVVRSPMPDDFLL